jgi:hypothetical protein
MFNFTRAFTRLAAPAWVLIVSLLLLTPPSTTHAQVLYGSLTGNVTDSAGAAVAGAKVQALNVGTNVLKETITNESGAYQFTDLLPGVYKVTISAQGFKTLLQEKANIEANTVRRLDVSLETGGVTETVTVSAEREALLQTDRSDVNVNQTTRQVNNLPLAGSAGRNYQSLMQIVPGATLAGEQNSLAGSPQRSISFNVNGVSRLQNNTKLDGASIQYPWLPTNTAYVPPAEAIQTVNIVTNAFDAEQGIAGGAAVNVIIKSGTNEFHGAGWVYHTNSKFRARNFFQPATQPQNPKDLLTQFGYAVGGPIIKNKLFFFTDLERTTRRQSSPTRFFTLPTAALRNGDFSGTGTTIYDPASNPDPRLRTPFPNNQIPADRIDLAAREMLKRLPATNLPGFNNNYIATGVAEYNRTNLDVKINYTPTERLSLFGRYSFSPHLIIDPPALGEAGGDALSQGAGGQQGSAPGRTQVAGLGGTYTFGPTLLLDVNLGYTRQRLGAQAPDINGTNFGLDVLKIPGTNGPDFLQSGIPGFTISGFSSLGNAQPANPFLFRDNQYVASANLSWFKGVHSFRFGLDYQNQQLNHFQPQGSGGPRGIFGFSGNATALQNGPAANMFNAFAAFLLGLPSSASKTEQLRNPMALRLKTYALYARDHWQVTPKLTFTYGLRWELYPFPTRDHVGVSRFDPDTGLVYTGGLSGVPEDTGANVGVGQFLPRLGVAYRAGEKTVIRGGYGQSADPRPYIDFRSAYPIFNSFSMPQPANPFMPVTTLRQGIINPFPAPDLTQGILPLPPNVGTTTYPKRLNRQEIHSFNFIVERQLPWGFTGSVGYVGTRAVGQMGYININAGAPGTGNAGRPLFTTDVQGNRVRITADITSVQPYRTATYDSLQSQFTRRWGSSILGIVYTWSKAINYADNDAGPRIQYMPEAERNRGLAGYDRPHNLQTYFVWDLPFGQGQRWASDGIAGKIFGGFQLNGIFSAMSNTPFSIVQGSAANLNAAGSGQVPDQVKPEVKIFGDNRKGIPPAGADPAAYQYFDRSAFAVVNIPAGQPQRFGNVGRNTLRGPRFINLDLGLFRTFSLSEHLKLQLRAEALNALNHPNFANPNGDISSGTFGFITSTTGTGERNFRFAARLSF